MACARRGRGRWMTETWIMFGLPFGGGGGGIIGALFSYGIFFVLNLVLQFFTGGLSELFPMDMMTAQ